MIQSWLLLIIGGLATATGSLVGRVLVSLGIGYVAFSGLDVLLSGVESAISNAFTGLPAIGLQVLSTLQLDTCLNIYLSALTAKLTLMGIGPNGVLTRMVTR